MAVGDWVPCQNYGVQVQADNQNGATLEENVILCQPGDAFGGVGEIAVVESEEEVLTKRVVGWVAHRCATVVDVTVVCHERIRVGLLDNAGNLSFYAALLDSASQANEPFLWERCSVIDIAGGVVETWPLPDVGTSDYAKIDVGVARKLRRSDVLVYTVQWSLVTAGEFDPGDVFSSFVWLRTWARKRG